MSDKEDGEEEDALGYRTAVKEVKVPQWRHKSFVEIFEVLDGIRGSEALIFTHANRPRMKRVRFGRHSLRNAPTGLPQSFFDEDYWDGLLPHARKQMKTSERDFPLREFHANNFVLPP